MLEVSPASVRASWRRVGPKAGVLNVPRVTDLFEKLMKLRISSEKCSCVFECEETVFVYGVNSLPNAAP